VRIAIACSGLDRSRRGFETFARDLFRHLQSEGTNDVVLFKGGGHTGASEFVLWNVPRGSPVWRLSDRFLDPYVGEQLTFALSLASRLKRENVDIVHLSDCQVASLLAHLIRGRRDRPRIVFSNGGPMSPADYRHFDFIQQVNPVELERAVSYGIDPSRMRLVPYGVDTERFRRSSGETLRSQLGIPEEAFLVLTVGAHGVHKRLDFLIRGMMNVGESVYLLIVGQSSPRDTAFLRELARRSLGGRVAFASYPYEDMPSVYSVADLYVHASLSEGFGLVFLEAMACGVPIVHHDEAGMNWIVNDAGISTDMTDREALTGTIRSLMADTALLRRLSRQARRRVEETFSWDVVLPRYPTMYSAALRIPPNAGRRAGE